MLLRFSEVHLSHRCSHLCVHLLSSTSDGNQPLHPAWGSDGCRGSGSIPKVILLKGLWLHKSEMSVVKYVSVPWTGQSLCAAVHVKVDGAVNGQVSKAHRLVFHYGVKWWEDFSGIGCVLVDKARANERDPGSLNALVLSGVRSQGSERVCSWFVKCRPCVYVCVCVCFQGKLARRWTPVACGFWWREAAGCVKKCRERRRSRPLLSPIHWLSLKVLTRCFQSDALCSSRSVPTHPAYNSPALAHLCPRGGRRERERDGDEGRWAAEQRGWMDGCGMRSL